MIKICWWENSDVFGSAAAKEVDNISKKSIGNGAGGVPFRNFISSKIWRRDISIINRTLNCMF